MEESEESTTVNISLEIYPGGGLRSKYPFKTATACDDRNIPDEPKSYFVSLTPSLLRFPYNDPRNHSKALTLWNRTVNALKCRIISPDPDLFSIHVEGCKPGPAHNLLLYGLAAKTITIRCTPGFQKIAKTYLQLHLHTHRNEHDLLHLPLQIFPSTSWFLLPKTITIPEVILGRAAHAIITLPQPPDSEKFFITFHPSFDHKSISVFPMNGVIGGEDGLKQLKVIYSPTEYTTISCVIRIHFPGLSPDSTHEIKIIGRCRPGNESDVIRKEITEIENFRPATAQPKRKLPKLKLKPIMNTSTYQLGVTQPQKKHINLFTPGGVMHFLLRNEDEYFKEEAAKLTAVELFAAKVRLSDKQKLRIFDDIKGRLGLSSMESQEDPIKFRKKFTASQRKQWEEFQKVVGLTLLGKKEELPSPKSSLRILTFKTKSTKPSAMFVSDERRVQLKAQVQKRISEEERKILNNILPEIPLDFSPREKFIQIARTVITRIRADRRLEKLRVLIKRTRNSLRKKSSTKSNSVTKSTGRRSSSVKQKSLDAINEMEVKPIGDSKMSMSNKSNKSMASDKRSQKQRVDSIADSRKEGSQKQRLESIQETGKEGSPPISSEGRDLQ